MVDNIFSELNDLKAEVKALRNDRRDSNSYDSMLNNKPMVKSTLCNF